MPRMEMGQFHALSLLLLFYYSRNMDNVDAEALRAYADRYVEPLLRELPHEYSGYQQLEYLHCVSLENKDTAFGQVLRDSYPLIFAFRGCMKSELESIRSEWPAGSVVSSLFNSYYKAAVIDDAVLPEYFEKYHIDSAKEQTLLNALLHSRPVAYDRREMETRPVPGGSAAGRAAEGVGRQPAPPVLPDADGDVHRTDPYPGAHRRGI